MSVVSPVTGRLIKIGSSEFEELLNDPKYGEFFLNPIKELPKGKVSSIQMNETELPPIDGSFNFYEPPSPTISLKNVTPTLSPIDIQPIAPPEVPSIENRIEFNKKSLPSITPPSPKEMKDILSMPFYDIPSLEETLAKTKQPAKREKLLEMINSMKEYDPRGNKTRGWDAREPQKGKERHQVKEECGDKCFLLPELEKFPICPSPRMSNDGKAICQIDSGGVQTAKNRAAQWGYTDVEKKADFILQDCENKGKFKSLPRLEQM